MNPTRRQFLAQSLVLGSLSIASSLPSTAARARTRNALGMFVYLDGREPDEAPAPVKELGFTCCEVDLNAFPDAYAAKLRAALDRLGLQATALFTSGPGEQTYDFYQGLDNQGVGLDTANLIMCGKGHPLDALDGYGQHLKAVNAKDGLFPTDARNLGRENPLGEGKVDFSRVMRRLRELNFTAPIIIEREITGCQLLPELRQAKAFLERLL
jgi:sugar phosphate isomerase/epimerase